MRPPESFIGQPVRSLQSMLQVIAANDPDYIAVIPDGIYGPATVQAVSVFQRKHMLPVTGVADLATWEAIVPVYRKSLMRQDKAAPVEVAWDPGVRLHLGDRHPNLYLVQAMLAVMAEAYHSIGKPAFNGILDEITADALSSFQMLNGLPETGDLDRITWTHLTAQYALAASIADRR